MATYSERSLPAEQHQNATGRTTYTTKEVGMGTGCWSGSRNATAPYASSRRIFPAPFVKHITDPQGRRIRAKHAIRQDGEQGAL